MLQRDADPGAVAGHRSGLPGAGADGRHAGGSWLSRLGREDRAALGIWGAAHLAFLVLAWAAAWAFRSSTAHAPLTGVFEHWDATLMREVAQYGYFGPHAVPNNDAFFPGYPVALRLAHLLLRNWVLAELAVPAVAGCFAVVALARLANEPPRRAVPVCPRQRSIFLMVGYAEALFLAFAVPAWLAASRGPLVAGSAPGRPGRAGPSRTASS